MNLIGFVVGLVLAFFSSWRMSLCTLAAVPFMVIIQRLDMQRFEAMQKTSKNSVGSGIVQENVTNIRTVRAMNIFDETLERFEKKGLDKHTSVCENLIQGFLFGMTQAMQFFIYAYVFYLGAYFIVHNGLNPVDMNRSLFCLMFAAAGAGIAGAMMGDIGKAKVSAEKIYDIIGMENKILYDENAEAAIFDFKGTIEFNNVWFKYPTRKNYVLKNLSFKIFPGQKIAFVGPSGQGKSTIIQLLLRFYEVSKGEITYDGINVKKIDLHSLRAAFGLVSQEPYLFNETIKYNIRYNTYSAIDKDIRDAAIISNAIKFIEQDEVIEQEDDNNKDATGFDRSVGIKGGNLSGGQKQRVAIARSVLRMPKVYLYDEATSALDSHSERVVQDALNRLSEKNTTISIAHRISTIQNSDVIFVLNKQRIVEEGDYEQLMEKKGLFYLINKDK